MRAAPLRRRLAALCFGRRGSKVTRPETRSSRVIIWETRRRGSDAGAGDRGRRRRPSRRTAAAAEAAAEAAAATARQTAAAATARRSDIIRRGFAREQGLGSRWVQRAQTPTEPRRIPWSGEYNDRRSLTETTTARLRAVLAAARGGALVWVCTRLFAGKSTSRSAAPYCTSQGRNRTRATSLRAPLTWPSYIRNQSKTVTGRRTHAKDAHNHAI